MYADDTIAAVATAQGPAGVGIVRVSGGLSASIAATIFRTPRTPAAWISHHLYHGYVVDEVGNVLDEALAVLMPGPRSYTGEDVLELHCHGSPVGLRRVLARVLGCGARLSEPGEFTKRAFLNGRVDLAQAEAVIDMVRSRTDAGAALAAQQLCGQLSAYLGALRAELIHLKAQLEAQIDFSEEDFEVSGDALRASIDRCIVSTKDLLDTYRHGRVVRNGVRVSIIGKPNVGKSSLLNALLGEDRAIVTPIAGTTRDPIEETADFDGVPVVLSDTAGLRPDAEADTVERVGMQRTAAKIAASHIVLAVLDASVPLDGQDSAVLAAAEAILTVVVLNKIDLPRQVREDEVRRLANGHPVLRVSAKQHLGLSELRSSVIAQVDGSDLRETVAPILTNLRHVDALQKAEHSLQLARLSIIEARPPDLVAVDLQDAIDHVGAITGVITTEDVLDKVFADFCIGK